MYSYPTPSLRRLTAGVLLLCACGDSSGPSTTLQDLAGTWLETACSVESLAPPARSEPCPGQFGALVLEPSGQFILFSETLPGEDSLQIPGHVERQAGGWRGFLAADGGFPVTLSDHASSMTWAINTNFVFEGSDGPEDAVLTQQWEKAPVP